MAAAAAAVAAAAAAELEFLFYNSRSRSNAGSPSRSRFLLLGANAAARCGSKSVVLNEWPYDGCNVCEQSETLTVMIVEGQQQTIVLIIIMTILSCNRRSFSAWGTHPLRTRPRSGVPGRGLRRSRSRASCAAASAASRSSKRSLWTARREEEECHNDPIRNLHIIIVPLVRYCSYLWTARLRISSCSCSRSIARIR